MGIVRLHNAFFVTPKASGWEIFHGSRRIVDGIVTDDAPSVPAERTLDLRGAVVLPGLVNAHHHIYSRLAKGLPVIGPTRNFTEILESLWWVLDRALDREAILLSAVLTLRECLRHGVTFVFDHHSSPGCISGILPELAEVYSALGVRGSVCLEISHRNGDNVFARSLDESLAFQGNTEVRPLLGLHAGFTLKDTHLREIAARSGNLPLHIHVAEAPVDVEFSRRSGETPITRLERYGLLRQHSLLIHGNYLTPRDLECLSGKPVTLVQNVESAMNNALVPADPKLFDDYGLRHVAGTDGMHSNMLRAWKSAFLLLREQRLDPTAGFEELDRTIRDSFLLKEEFGFGCGLRLGEPADLIVTDYRPGMELNADNWLGHLLYGVTEAEITHVFRGERILLDDGQLAPDSYDSLCARQPEIVTRLRSEFTRIAH